MSEDSEERLDSVDAQIPPYTTDVQESLAPQTHNCKWTDWMCNMTSADARRTLLEMWSSSSARDSLTGSGRNVELVCRRRKMQTCEGVCFPRTGLLGGLERWEEGDFETRDSELVRSRAGGAQGSSWFDIGQICPSVLGSNQGWWVEWKLQGKSWRWLGFLLVWRAFYFSYCALVCFGTTPKKKKKNNMTGMKRQESSLVRWWLPESCFRGVRWELPGFRARWCLGMGSPRRRAPVLIIAHGWKWSSFFSSGPLGWCFFPLQVRTTSALLLHQKRTKNYFNKRTRLFGNQVTPLEKMLSLEAFMLQLLMAMIK